MATTTKVIPALPEATIATGDIIYYDTDEFQKVSVSTAGKVLTTVAGKPAWVEPSAVDDNHFYARYTADYPVANGAWTDLEWDSGVSVVDPQTMLYDAVSNPSKIRPTATGRYLVTLNTRWENNSTNRRIIEIRHKNSSDETLNRSAIQVGANSGSEGSASGIFEIGTADSEYFLARAYQDSGTNPLDLLGTATPATSGAEEFTTITVQRLSS